MQAEATGEVTWFGFLVVIAVCSLPLLTVWYFARRDLRQFRSPSPETWAGAREKKRCGEFQRKVKRRIAISLEYDNFELECGHRWPAVGEQQESYECKECLDAWVKAETKAGR